MSKQFWRHSADFSRADGARIWQQGIDEAGNVIGVVTSEFLWLLWGCDVGLICFCRSDTANVCPPICAALAAEKSSWGSRIKARDGPSQA